LLGLVQGCIDGVAVRGDKDALVAARDRVVDRADLRLGVTVLAARSDGELDVVLRSAALASLAIETKYGFVSVFRTSETPTALPLAPELPLLAVFFDELQAESASAAHAAKAIPSRTPAPPRGRRDGLVDANFMD
jgi:hypothetical protein